MMLTFHTVRKCNTNCLLTAFQQPFNSNFSPWLAVSVGRGVMAPGPLGADGATQSVTIVVFYPQAIWIFWLLLLSLSKAMKAAGRLTKTGVTGLTFLYPVLCFLLSDTAAGYISLLSLH